MCICPKEGCNELLGKLPATTSTSTTTTPKPKPGALQCHKCNDVPNPGGGLQDACDATEHFGNLVVSLLSSSIMYKDFTYQDCSVELPDPKGNIYCGVTNVTGGQLAQCQGSFYMETFSGWGEAGLDP